MVERENSDLNGNLEAAIANGTFGDLQQFTPDEQAELQKLLSEKIRQAEQSETGDFMKLASLSLELNEALLSQARSVNQEAGQLASEIGDHRAEVTDDRGNLHELQSRARYLQVQQRSDDVRTEKASTQTDAVNRVLKKSSEVDQRLQESLRSDTSLESDARKLVGDASVLSRQSASMFSFDLEANQQELERIEQACQDIEQRKGPNDRRIEASLRQVGELLDQVRENIERNRGRPNIFDEE